MASEGPISSIWPWFMTMMRSLTNFTYPCLIVEVLSDSSEAHDRGAKFRLYRNNPVLQDYLLVSTARIEMDLYHKNDAGGWIIHNYQEGDTITLKSIDLSFPIEQVYRGLVLTPENASSANA